MTGPHVAAPESEVELLARARALGGRTLGELAERRDSPLPTAPVRAKGKIGELVERHLGAGGSAPGPDLPALGIEIKTLPIDSLGQPCETTFVAFASTPGPWLESNVYSKLKRVLWVPIESDKPIAERRVGSAFIWSPDDSLADTLERDWLELSDLLCNSPECISATRGEALQLRPKARSGSVRVVRFDSDEAPIWTQPRGFYLRRWVTIRALESAGF